MSSVFTKIIQREIPAFIIAENNDFIAFLDVFPIQKGHVLVVPKKEVDNFFDVPNQLLEQWLVFAKPIAKAIQKAFNCNRCGVSVIGLEVPHAHMHLVPIDNIGDMDFKKEKLKLSPEEFLIIQKAIMKNMP